MKSVKKPGADPHPVRTERLGAVVARKIVKDLRLSMKRDMETAIRRDIQRLEPGLTIVDGGMQRRVASGRRDIFCKDAQGHRVVIKLKAGKSDRQVVSQILGCMGDLMAEDALPAVRGINVAHDFVSSSLSKARNDPRLTLYSYVVDFTCKPIT